MIQVTALKWVPPFAQGQVRDHRVRWVLEEVGWQYEIDLIDAPTQASDEYRAEQPFGQVPVMREDGRTPLFESGAIVVDVALRSGQLIPDEPDARAQTLAWVFAALNSIEPYLANLAEVEFFLKDEEQKRIRRPEVMQMVDKRLGELQTRLGERAYFVGDTFTVADLMVASVLKIARSLDVLGGYPTLDAWQASICERPAYEKAIADQCATFAAHGPRDMRYPKTTA